MPEPRRRSPGARNAETHDPPELELRVASLAMLSHELRTPLTSILGYLELVLSEQAGPLTEEQRRFLEAVERNARRLVRTSEEILFLGKEEGDKAAEDVGLRHDDPPARD